MTGHHFLTSEPFFSPWTRIAIPLFTQLWKLVNSGDGILRPSLNYVPNALMFVSSSFLVMCFTLYQAWTQLVLLYLCSCTTTIIPITPWPNAVCLPFAPNHLPFHHHLKHILHQLLFHLKNVWKWYFPHMQSTCSSMSIASVRTVLKELELGNSKYAEAFCSSEVSSRWFSVVKYSDIWSLFKRTRVEKWTGATTSYSTLLRSMNGASKWLKLS